MSTSLLTLRTRARQRTNMENNTGFVTDAELTDMLNCSLGDLDDTLVSTYEDYKLTDYLTSISTPVEGQNYFALPSDFLKCRGVDRQFNGTYMTMDNYNFTKRNQYSFPVMNFVYGYLDVYYRIQDGYCFVIPWQNCAANYRLWYIPKFLTLVNDGDVLPAYMDTQAWSEYAVVDTCIKILAKQDLDPTTFMAQKAALQARIINAAKPRDAGPVKRVQNTRYNRGWMGPGWNSDE